MVFYLLKFEGRAIDAPVKDVMAGYGSFETMHAVLRFIVDHDIFGRDASEVLEEIKFFNPNAEFVCELPSDGMGHHITFKVTTSQELYTNLLLSKPENTGWRRL